MEKVTIIQVRGSNKFNLMIGTWLCPDHRQVHWDNELKLATSASTASTNHYDDNNEDDDLNVNPRAIKTSSTSASTASTNHDDDNKEEDSNVKPPPYQNIVNFKQ